MSTISLGEKVNEAIQEKANSSSENIDEGENLKIDFHQRTRLAYTRPVKVIYFDENLHADTSWTDVYIKLMKALYKDYPEVIPVGTHFTGVGRVDFGNQVQAKSMTAPKRIYMGMYLETNLSATYIVRKIRALLDICHVNYENVVIYYKHKENKERIINNPKLQAIRISNARESGYAPDEREFYAYLHDSARMADATCRSYTSTIRIAEKYAFEHCLEHSQLYNRPPEETSNTIKALFSDPGFLEYNEQQHNRFRSAINKLLECMGCTSVVPRRNASAAVAPMSGNFDTKLFKTVLEQRFVKGFRLGSTLDMKKFKRYYEELNGTPANIKDGAIEKGIRSCGIVHEDKVFLPKTMLSDDVKARLLTYIEDSFNSGKNSIYFEALFREFSEDFLDHYIYNVDMLRAYLVFWCSDKYVIDRNQIFKEAGANTAPIEEVRSCLKVHGTPMEKDDLYAVLVHLPQKTVDAILGSNGEFVRDRKGVYFHADMLALSEEELAHIAALIEDAVCSYGYISGTELMKAIRAKYPRMYESYVGYSDLGWRGALKYKFGTRFLFRGNIISNGETPLSRSEVFAQIARESDTLTMDALRALADGMGIQIDFDAVYQNAVRMDEDTFVNNKRAAFRVAETDNILDRFCTGKYVPLAAVRDFGIFPDAGFPWTVYLLESYAAFYSERYALLHGGYNRTCAVGAIVKKTAGYEDFDDLLVDVMADSRIALHQEEALTFLRKRGYIARRHHTNIEALMIRARAKRNNKGRP